MFPKDLEEDFHLRVHIWVIEAGQFPLSQTLPQEEAVLMLGSAGAWRKTNKKLPEQQEVAGPSYPLNLSLGRLADKCLAATETFF